MSILLWVLKSCKRELYIVLITLAVLMSIPAAAVVVFADAGIQLISDALVSVNPATRLVEIFDSNGNKVAELELSTNWPARGYVSDEFGTWEAWRKALGLGPHTGTDIANQYGDYGDPITPFMVGKVLYNHDVDDNSCGKHVKLQHEHNITSLYCHLDSTAGITPGTNVKPGDIIGYMGNTGSSTGVHLHFMIQVYGINVNPRTFMVGEPEGSVNRVSGF